MSLSALKMFEIKNLFNQYDVMLPFDQDVNIFIGENGMGKTTILSCLYYVLNNNIEKLIPIIFDSINLYFNDGTIATLNKNDLISYKKQFSSFNYLVINKKFDIENYFSKKDLIELRRFRNFSSHMSNIELENNFNYFFYKLKNDSDLPADLAYKRLKNYIDYGNAINLEGNIENIKNFKKIIEEKVTDDILYFPTYRRIEEDFAKLGINIDEEFKKQNNLIQFGMSDVEDIIKKILEYIKDASITSFKKMTGVMLQQYLDGKLENEIKIDSKKLSIALSRISNEIKESERNKIQELVDSGQIYNEKNTYLLNLIKNLINSYERQSEYDNQIKDFINICNNYLTNKKYNYNESKLELNIIKNNTNLPIGIQNLSSGEKQIISIFSKLYLEKLENKNKTIILFDEPELSLSINWQKNFLPDIMKSEKCSMLIAVTHSPFIFYNEYDLLAKDMGTCIQER